MLDTLKTDMDGEILISGTGFQFMSVNLNWITKDIELKFEQEWQEVKFTLIAIQRNKLSLIFTIIANNWLILNIKIYNYEWLYFYKYIYKCI